MVSYHCPKGGGQSSDVSSEWAGYQLWSGAKWQIDLYAWDTKLVHRIKTNHRKSFEQLQLSLERFLWIRFLSLLFTYLLCTGCRAKWEEFFCLKTLKTTYSVFRNYPNPFTSITLHVTLFIYSQVPLKCPLINKSPNKATTIKCTDLTALNDLT